MTRRKVDIVGMVYRPSDPKAYGYICPHCYRRYGSRPVSGVIEVERCAKCPSLSALEQIIGMKKRALKQKRAEGVL